MCGLLCGLAIALALDMSLLEAAWRTFVLAAVAGCMGALLACLDDGIKAIPKANDDANRGQES